MYRRIYLLVGIALAVAAVPLAAQPGIGIRTGLVINRETIESNIAYQIFTDPVVQAELKLTEEQKAQIAKIPDDPLAKHKEAIEKEQAANKAAAENRWPTRPSYRRSSTP